MYVGPCVRQERLINRQSFAFGLKHEPSLSAAAALCNQGRQLPCVTRCLDQGVPYVPPCFHILLAVLPCVTRCLDQDVPMLPPFFHILLAVLPCVTGCDDQGALLCLQALEWDGGSCRLRRSTVSSVLVLLLLNKQQLQPSFVPH
eukprot:1161421-Pelagomonas_calceolata.AAC.2